MADVEREIMFLPKKPGYVVQTAAFPQMKKGPAPLVAKAKQGAANEPRLNPHEKGCPHPRKSSMRRDRGINKLRSSAPAQGRK
jgi:hypothetical protein